ncbi:MAG: hypothetical protein ACUVX8_17730 [Candidatus Zipacnadales bacterium]
MSITSYRMPISVLLLTLALSFSGQRIAYANDADAVIGGILAGALVYELLDDDDDYCYRSSYHYYAPPCYRGGYCVEYYRYPRPYIYHRYNYCPRTYVYEYYDYEWDTPRYSFRAERAPSHAKPVGPPAGYYRGGGPGRKYSPPRGYKW